MTRRQRAQVVELLRCAADIAVTECRYSSLGTECRYSSLGTAARRLDVCTLPFLAKYIGGDGHWSQLIRGLGPVEDGDHTTPDVRLVSGTGYEFCLLEAAARVEEGTWP